MRTFEGTFESLDWFACFSVGSRPRLFVCLFVCLRVEDPLKDVLELFGRNRADKAHEDGDEADGAETALVHEVRIVLIGCVFRLTKGNDAARVNPVHLNRAEP